MNMMQVRLDTPSDFDYRRRKQPIVQHFHFREVQGVQKGQEGAMSYNDLIDAYKHEKEELKKFADKKRLVVDDDDEMEEDHLQREHDFLFFRNTFTDTDNTDDTNVDEEKDQNCDSDSNNTMCNATMNISISHLQPSAESNVNAGGNSPVITKDDEILNMWLSGLQDFL